MLVSRPALAVAPLLLLLSGAAVSQATPEQQALARAQALLRQVSAQKQELETANARLKAEAGVLERKLSQAEASLKKFSLDLQSEQRKSERANEFLESTRERLARAEATIQEAKRRLNEAGADLRSRDDEIVELRAQLGQARADFADSERKNLQLYRANVELLELYQNKGAWAAILQREPTGLKNVELENVVQEYRLKLQDSLTETNRKSAWDGAANAPDEAQSAGE